MWGSVLECGGRCREMLREVWGSMLGCVQKSRGGIPNFKVQ